MKRLLILLAFSILSSGVAFAQCGAGGKLIGSVGPYPLCASATVSQSGAPSNPCPAAGVFDFDTSGSNNVYSCGTAGGSWVLINTGSGGASALYQMTDVNATKTSSTVMTLCSSCTSTTPALIGFRWHHGQVTTSPTVTVSGGTDNVYIYALNGSTITLYAGTNSATIACASGITCATGITGFPTNSQPLWELHATSGTWDAVTEAMDYRAYNTTANVTATNGVTSSDSNGDTQLAVDQTVVPYQVAVPGSLTNACTPGNWAMDATYLYWCYQSGAWKEASWGAGTGVTGPGSSTDLYVPQWNGTTGAALRAGLPVVSTAATSAIVESTSNGYIDPSWLIGASTTLTDPAAGALSIGSPYIDGYTTVNITITSAGRNYSLPTPNSTGSVHFVRVNNTGNPTTPQYAFTLGGSNIQPGTGLVAEWIPANAAWNVISAPTPGPDVYIVGLGCPTSQYLAATANATVCLNTFVSAYNDCYANVHGTGTTIKSCVIYDNTLTSITTGGVNAGQTETINGTPWPADGTDTGFVAYFGPGILYTTGPVTSTRAGMVAGVGPTLSSNVAGTTIRASTAGCSASAGVETTGCQFGGISGATVSAKGTGCHNSDLFNVASTNGSGAVLKAVCSNTPCESGTMTVNPYIEGGGYGGASSFTSVLAGTTNNCSVQPTLTAPVIDTALAHDGDITVVSDTFGARMQGFTLDCNGVGCSSGLEIINAQEESYVDEVNIINYGVAGGSGAYGGGNGIYIHGSKTNNLEMRNVQVNGCISGGAVCQAAGNTTLWEVDNTYLKTSGHVTLNPVNMYSQAVTSTSCSGTGPYTITITLAATPSVMFTNPGGVQLTGVTGGSGMTGVYDITAIAGSVITAVTYGHKACSGSGTGGTAIVAPRIGLRACAGSGCEDGNSQGPVMVNMMVENLHTENLGMGTKVQGGTTTNNLVSFLSLQPTMATTTGVVIEFDAAMLGTACVWQPWAGGSGGIYPLVQDDILGVYRYDPMPWYCGGTANPGASKLFQVTGSQTAVPESSGSAVPVIATVATKTGQVIPAGACFSWDVSWVHSVGTSSTDYALQLTDGTHYFSWLLDKQSAAVTNYVSSGSYCNNPGSQTAGTGWLTGNYKGLSALSLTAGSFFNTLTLTTSAPITLNVYACPSSTGACTFTNSAAVPLAQNGAWSTDTFTANQARIKVDPL